MNKTMKKNLLLSFVLLLFASIILITGCKNYSTNYNTTPTTTAKPGTNEVWLQNSSFVPASISVLPGTKITWTNKDGYDHTVTSGTPGKPTRLFDSGNIAEIISLVQELDENRLLKTDLLGDAIESSLSESGGTKDIGLYRTPDHIRQFMVALTGPNFNDVIFDPACGTGGFLFDSFEFVMQRVKASYKEFDKWPGLKAHHELQTWFNNFFADNSLPFPSEDIAHNF